MDIYKPRPKEIATEYLEGTRQASNGAGDERYVAS